VLSRYRDHLTAAHVQSDSVCVRGRWAFSYSHEATVWLWNGEDRGSETATRGGRRPFTREFSRPHPETVKGDESLAGKPRCVDAAQPAEFDGAINSIAITR
jgi:hypothetical protein